VEHRPGHFVACHLYPPPGGVPAAEALPSPAPAPAS